jgi:hypothetical protein
MEKRKNAEIMFFTLRKFFSSVDVSLEEINNNNFHTIFCNHKLIE